MGKIYEALEKSRRENLLINKGLGEQTQFKEQRMEESVSTGSNLKMPDFSAPKKKIRRLISRKHKYLTNMDLIITEQFRALKTKIFYTMNGNAPRTLLITSALPVEGKSMVAANLAITLAQGAHEHALLVDCDFRKPYLHKLFGLTPEKGLADYLSGNAEIHTILSKTDTPKIHILPVGQKPLNPLDLLASTKMKQLVQELKARYNDRYIIFDSSPIQLASETRFLLSQVDAAILVVQAGRTDRRVVKKIVQDMDKEKLLGVVLNCLQKSISNQQYYTYSSY